MKLYHARLRNALILPLLLACIGTRTVTAQVPRYPVQSKVAEKSTRGAITDKLGSGLRALYTQFTLKRGGDPEIGYSPGELSALFGIAAGDRAPSIRVNVKTVAELAAADLDRIGAAVISSAGLSYRLRIPVSGLDRLARLEAVQSVTPSLNAGIPPPPTDGGAPQFAPMDGPNTRGEKVDSDFDHQGHTGKNVIIGFCDTGIDWKHPDFITADGRSRILYIWDMTDESYEESRGRIGSKPPIAPRGTPLGTLYTNEQINNALAGKGQVEQWDNHGHGTACAGVAAGNGRAAGNGIAPGTYVGVAPDADIIMVKAGEGSFSSDYVEGVKWMADVAKKMGRPISISLSLGGHNSGHDGNLDEERTLSSLVGDGRKGISICVAAGNEHQYLFHASGRFGPREEGQADIRSSPVELTVSEDFGSTLLSAYFDHSDDWGLSITSSDVSRFSDRSGNPVFLHIYKSGRNTRHDIQASAAVPATTRETLGNSYEVETLSNGMDHVLVKLPEGHYRLWGFGASETVTNGRFDLYLPVYYAGLFSKGNDPTAIVGSPGNADRVITVGSYDFRGAWGNLRASKTKHNMIVGAISPYSCSGYRRDGVIKPDITAPGQYAISAASRTSTGAYCRMAANREATTRGTDSTRITTDGYHIAWNGTSAATPFVAGVIALMLEKNPNLDALEIHRILTTTARTDNFTGAVPNREWGYGKINPAAALAATPSP